MGFITNRAKGSQRVPVKVTKDDASRRQWRETFRGVSKEEGGTGKRSEEPARSRPPVPGGTYGRSSVTSEASFKRLLQAMRSMAPGGWSDDRVEEENHFVGITYVAIHRICCQWMQAEFQVFKKDESHPEGKRPITKDDPVEGDRSERPWRLVELLEKPNNQDSFGSWLYRAGQQKYLTGTALNWLVPNRFGTPAEMYIISTSIAIPQPAVNPDFPDGYYRIQPVYPYGPFSSYPTPSSAVGAPIPAQWMMRFQFPHPVLRYEGFSPLTALRLHIDEVESIDRSRFYKMRRSSNPDAVLNFEAVEGQEPLPEAEIERIKAEFEYDFQGEANHGRLYVSAPGAKLEEYGTKPKEMDYGQGWDQLTSFILAGFGITKAAVGMNETSSYANQWASLKQLHTLVLKPDLDDIAAKITRHIGPFFGDDLIVEIRCPRIDDHEIAFQKVDKLNSLKGLPKAVIRLALQLLDLPIDDEVVEELTKAGEQQQQQEMMAGASQPMEEAMIEQGQVPEMPGMEREEAPVASEADGDYPGLDTLFPDEEEQGIAEQPDTGSLGAGGLGPRKGLKGYKGLLAKYRKRSTPMVHLNGNGRH